MSMKQSIQLKLGQHLTMTPQLQQAIRLLQLSSLELTAEVQDALDSNMMLEVDEGPNDVETPEVSAEISTESAETDGDLYSFEASTEGDTEARGTTEDIPAEMPIDSDWEEVYDSMGAGSASVRTVDASTAADFESIQTADTSLRDHLDEQLNLMTLSNTDQAIALILIDSLDEYGYLNVELDSK